MVESTHPLIRFGAPVLLAALAFTLTAYISLVIFRDYPFSLDEVSYAYQAEIFAQGRTSLPIDQRLYPLREFYMLIVDGQIFSKYPPGTSAVMALGASINAMGLVNPWDPLESTCRHASLSIL